MKLHGGFRLCWLAERDWGQLVDGFEHNAKDFVLYFIVSRLSIILEHVDDIIQLVFPSQDCLGEHSKPCLHLVDEWRSHHQQKGSLSG